MNISHTFLLVMISCTLTSQSQIKWNATKDLAASSFGNNHPRIVLNGDESPVVVWGRDSDASLHSSYWDGNKFAVPTKLNQNITVATASWMGPDIASHGDTIYIVMKQTPENNSNSGIFLTSSFDGGKSFSTLILIDKIADSLSRFPTVSTDQYGSAIVAFMKFNSSFKDSRWVVSKSTDFGLTFLQDIKASNWFGSEEVCDCCPGVLISEKENCVLLYRDNNKNIRDSWMSVSYNSGKTFSNACNVDNLRWNISSCPSSGPDAIIVNDTVYSVFMSGSGGRTLAYLSKTTLSEAKHIKTSSLLSYFVGLNNQNFPRIAKYGKSAAIVWKQDVSNKLQLPLLYTRNIEEGFPSTYDTVALLNIDNADVALTQNKIFVVWEDFASRTVKYRIGEIQTTTDVLKTNASSKFVIFPCPANDEIKINGPEKLNYVKITDLQGKIIYQNANQQSNHLSISKLKSGIYYLQCESDNQTYLQKFIKQ